MSTIANEVRPKSLPLPADLLPARQIWIHVVMAALAMVATLPGRTHGLGLITEPLLKDLQLDRVQFADLNLWATLLGALFCLPCGWLIDRLGPRIALTGVAAALGAVVITMSRVQAGWWTVELSLPAWLHSRATHLAMGLFFLILLTRGLGQSALSVTSLALIGRSAQKHSGPAFGVYSFVVALGFMIAFKSVGWTEKRFQPDWRSEWAGIGIGVMAFALLAAVLLRPAAKERMETHDRTAAGATSCTLSQALLSPTFWVFGIATSLYGAIAAGIALFNQSILEERGFNRQIYIDIATVTPLVGLASNLTTGWLTTRISMNRLLAGSMLGLAGALALFPFVQTLPQVYVYAVAMGIVGGMVTVLFFAVWSRAFGPAHLGKIQGVAQMLTVLASALGPRVLATSKEWHGSYVPVFYRVAAISAVLGVAAWFIIVRRNDSSTSQQIR